MKKQGNSRPAAGRPSSGSTATGLMIGLVLGVLIAFGIVWYMNKTPLPFQDKGSHAADPGAAANVPPAPLPGKPGDKPVDKPRFDFYKILPQGEGATPTPTPAPSAALPPAPTQTEQFYLQLGAFQKAGDADNLKARLALMGVEASVQDVDTGDKGLLHRVRAGPYPNPDDMNRVRNQLAQSGIQATVVKTKDAPAPDAKPAETKPAKP